MEYIARSGLAPRLVCKEVYPAANLVDLSLKLGSANRDALGTANRDYRH